MDTTWIVLNAAIVIVGLPATWILTCLFTRPAKDWA